MQYNEFLEHIYRKYSGNVKLGLERMQELWKALGQPQEGLRGFHIAGTNGKGSVCASLEALCRTLEGNVGLNTSPHLINYTERFRIDGRDLDFEEVLACFTEHEQLFEACDASFFEITTALAILLFRKHEVKHTVLEVGLGGRLDATNLWIPDITAITSIGLDHVKTLGNTLELIAREKAGIIKEGVPLVLGKLDDSPKAVIQEMAEAKSVPVYQYGKDIMVTDLKLSPLGTEWNYEFKQHRFRGLRANLIGAHQAHNVSLALTSFILYLEKLDLELSEESLRHALARINWQGRMQVIHHEPAFILDGAHNVQGITALMESLEQIYPGRKVKFVLSILADKDYSEMIHLVCSKASQIYVAQNHSERAATVEAQMKAIARYEVPATACADVPSAYRQALAEAASGDVIIGGGSLYTVGEILKASAKG
ncbi:MAG: folylpolyglutamate synthase/dihydrofolate synthase family protein [Candidatus Cloacimonadota bacterium]